MNAGAEVDKPALQRNGDIQVFSPEEVWSLVRAAASTQDAAIYLTAAFTGLRLGELLALRWREVDFSGSAVRVRASYAAGALTTPKSGKVRALPLAPEVASALAQAGQRGDWVGMTISCSAARPAAISTGRRCGVATSWRSPRRGCGPCASMTYGTPQHPVRRVYVCCSGAQRWGPGWAVERGSVGGRGSESVACAGGCERRRGHLRP